MLPGASKRAPKGSAIFFETRNIQKFCEFCRGMDGHEMTNYVHRTMYI